LRERKLFEACLFPVTFHPYNKLGCVYIYIYIYNLKDTKQKAVL
jgi:hypothetical protein